jgi:hypothetical protein
MLDERRDLFFNSNIEEELQVSPCMSMHMVKRIVSHYFKSHI